MRRPFVLACVMTACWFSLPASTAFAQMGGGPGGGAGGDDSDDSAAQKKKDDEWNTNPTLAPLPGSKNAGPCPYVKVLYDAGRYIEFKNDQVASSAVAYTGEFQGLSSACNYKASEPIQVQMELLFGFGRGPQADASTKTYHYWVAVTDRNLDVLDKQEFEVKAVFPPGQDRVLVTDDIKGIVIPRGDANVSGSNFEVLVGFDVTPEMADFNRQGKRFRANAGAAAEAGLGSSSQQ